MSEQLFHTRKFLNDETGAVIIEARFEDGSWWNNQKQERHVRPGASGE